MNRRPIHGELGGAGTFDYHLDDREVVEIETVPAAGIALIETGTLAAYRGGLSDGLTADESGYVHLDVRQLDELIGELTKARDYLREHSA